MNPSDSPSSPAYGKFQKFLIVLFGVIVPIGTFVFHNTLHHGPFFPDYDDKTIWTWLMLADSHDVQIYFYPLILVSMVALLLEIYGRTSRRSPWTTTGLCCGTILSGIFTAWYFFAPAWSFSLLGVIFTKTIHIKDLPPVLLLFIAGVAPHAAFVTYLVTLIRHLKYRRKSREKVSSSLFAPTVITSSLGLTSLTLAILKMRELHAALPQNPPNCYLATIAARGASPCHQTIIRSPSGDFAVTRQLRIFKAWEIVVMTLFPRIHRLLRGYYDRLGPPLARMTASRARIVYIILIPCALVFLLSLRLLFRDANKVARESYGNSSS
ncbi:MAG: hypothetical protein A2Z34_03550 [Planctomycetes bacterium RBG_16_59_8]|nr:MAG: hypothetical protein A2Z34_03550 [Planctomycetes bacterium RBG_16_59_8]